MAVRAFSYESFFGKFLTAQSHETDATVKSSQIVKAQPFVSRLTVHGLPSTDELLEYSQAAALPVQQHNAAADALRYSDLWNCPRRRRVTRADSYHPRGLTDPTERDRRCIIARYTEPPPLATCPSVATHITRYNFFGALARMRLTKPGIWHTSVVSQPPNLHYVISLDVTAAAGVR